MNTSVVQTRVGCTAADVVAGQWFWHEPWPGYRVPLQAAGTSRHGHTVRIVTTDSDREVVQYRFDRPVRLVRDADPIDSLSGVLPLSA
ncbi:hypothetical protein ACFWNN_03815 [Lentzea sp. NPDC058450]|uniref:hypothetical protein n=1 Tax=Lentzea sp. NPDC058450 TaxID=3346505 RepID=UPI00364683E2